MKDITVSELVKCQVNLEKELLEIMNQKLRDFNRKTGIGITGIRVSFIDTRSIGEPKSQQLLSDVSVYLELEDEEKGDK